MGKREFVQRREERPGETKKEWVRWRVSLVLLCCWFRF